MADTTVPSSLVKMAWAKDTWETGVFNAYFNRFIGDNAYSVIQRKTDLKKGEGTSIRIPLVYPLKGAGVWDDNILEGNEEAMRFGSFDVYLHQIRQAVRLEGRYEEQKTQINMRKEAREQLSNWLSTFIDDSIFGILTGVKAKYAEQDTGYQFPVEAPTRVLYAGTGVTAEGSITTTDTFTANLIGQAKRMATANRDTAIRPIRVDGRNTYVMVIDPYQARDLRNDPKWIAAQQHANVRGEKNPIFSGAMGIYDGVVIHEHNSVPRTATGASNIMVGHALFLGAQAAEMAVGEMPLWETKAFDYGNKQGFSIGRFVGLKRSVAKYDGTNNLDYGCINVLTSSIED